MSRNPQDQKPAVDANLEDRMRGLIMGNSQGPAVQNQPQRALQHQLSPSLQPATPAFIPTLPPHMRGASLAAQQEYLQRNLLLAQGPPAQGPPAQPIQPIQPPQPPRGPVQSPQGTHNKRLNQYQRRQLANQMATPFVEHPSAPAPQASFSPSNRFSHPVHGQPQNNVAFQQQHQQPRVTHPATGPSYHRPWQPQMHTRNTPGFGGQFPSQHQGHHQVPPAQQYQPGHQQSRNGQDYQQRPPPQNRQLFQPGPHGGPPRTNTYGMSQEQIAAQSAFLESLVQAVVPLVGVDDVEIAEKEAFRANVERTCRAAIATYEQEELGNPKFQSQSVQLKCFGSMASGFATKASDMDLALLSPQSKIPPESSDSPIPRILEKALLDMGYGARLLTRTRVPIIKLCEKPTEKLRADLLQERLKWENGFDVEGTDEEAVEEAVEEGLGVVEKIEISPDATSVTTVVSETIKTPEDIYKETLTSFRQKKSLSLGDYYGSAKRLLRDLGGRDVGAAYATSPSIEEVRILADVCEAFVNGLESYELRDRLLTYHSMVFERDGNPTMAKSLSGVFSQIEGERLAMAWEHRPLPEKNELLDSYGAEQIEQWKTMLNCTTTESGVYNRRLHQACERLKKIPSLQLAFLEHGEHESVSQYYARTTKIMHDLGGKDDATSENAVLAIVITHYINGIKDVKTRESIQAFHSQNQLAHLSTIHLHHRIHELARDFEKALSKNLYESADRPHVERYIALLRSASTSTSLPPAILPSTPDLLPLLEKIASLPDPTGASKPRDRYHDPLEFPKTKIGIQCDINFAASLALHNTALLRCYALTDARVKPLVLFVKHWAKRRGINTPYRGTLSSYGYVLMVLHYLTNIATPPVCPNLQLVPRPPPAYLPPAEAAAQTTCQGADVRFWRNERELAGLAARGALNHNTDSLGALLRGFFEYYAHTGHMSAAPGRGFEWGREVLSLRTKGGILTKQEKGWVGARTVMEPTHAAAPPPPVVAAADAPLVTAPTADAATDAQAPPPAPPAQKPTETKEIRHRYLFALEDPFETDHNVARTVTHNGIVAIRDELRRAWRVVKEVGLGRGQGGGLGPGAGLGQGGPGREGGLLDELRDPEVRVEGVLGFLRAVHGLGEEFVGGPVAGVGVVGV